jgi:hypothetical protein
MSIKKILLQEIESSPDFLLEESLDFLRFLKTKQESAKKDTEPHNQTDSPQPAYRAASGRSILRHAGTWSGDDFHECLQSVDATRGKAKFDSELTHSDPPTPLKRAGLFHSLKGLQMQGFRR